MARAVGKHVRPHIYVEVVFIELTNIVWSSMDFNGSNPMKGIFTNLNYIIYHVMLRGR